jgi:hypothetical protein
MMRLASIAAVPRAKQIVVAFACAAAVAGVSACGGEDEPEPSIPREDAEGLVAELDEVRANVDEGSCIVAGEQAEEFLARVDELPSDVDEDVRDALEDGGNQLVSLTSDPDQCESQTETLPTETEETEPTETEPTDTEPTETQETQPTETTETVPTEPTTPTQPGGGSGGVGPGGFGP